MCPGHEALTVKKVRVNTDGRTPLKTHLRLKVDADRRDNGPTEGAASHSCRSHDCRCTAGQKLDGGVRVSALCVRVSALCVYYAPSLSVLMIHLQLHGAAAAVKHRRCTLSELSIKCVGVARHRRRLPKAQIEWQTTHTLLWAFDIAPKS